MVRTLILAIAAFALAAPAAGQVTASLERPTLRAEATVTGKLVRIGDLVEHAGAAANIPIFRAPDLGSTGTIPAARVIEAVRPHAIIGLDPGPVTDVTVTRASRAIPATEVEATITAALAREFPIGEGADISLKFDRPLNTLQVEPSSRGELHVAQLRFDQRSGRFDASLDIANDASIKFRLTGTAIATAEVITVNRPLARGEVLKMTDLTLERRPRSEIAGDTIGDPEQAIGLAARNTLGVGRPLRNADLMKPELVQRNDMVTIVYEVPGVLLSMRGKAVDGGAEGDMIDVLNVQSKRTLRATVTGPGRVSVASMEPRAIGPATETPSVTPARDGAK